MPARRIAVAAFVRAEITEDGAALKLVLEDCEGGAVVLSLPISCLGALLASLPLQQEPPVGTVSEVQSWRLDRGEAEPGLTLTLLTPEGRVAAFRVTHGQIAGIATLAAYGGLSARTARTIN